MLETNLIENYHFDNLIHNNFDNKRKKEKVIMPIIENKKILIELKNSFNDENLNCKINFNDTKETYYDHSDEVSETNDKIKTNVSISSDIQGDGLLGNIDNYFEKKNGNSEYKEIKSSSFRKKIYKIFFIRLLYAFIYGIIGVYIQCYSIILSDSYYNTGDEPLKDRIHELIKKIPSFMDAGFINGNIMIFFIITILRFGLFFPFLLSLTILIRLIFMLSTIYYVRSLFIYVTTLPCPIPTCQPLKNKGFLDNIYSSHLIIFAQVYECTDLIISGHTAFTTLLKYLWLFYEKNIYIKICICFYSLFIFSIIIISRFHYTVDVLMGYAFGASIFIFYHCLLDIAAKRYAINKSFYVNYCGYSRSFTERCNLFHYLIPLIGYIEALDYRLNISTSYDKEWSSFCPCKPVNSKSLINKKKNIRNEDYYDFSDHFYHSYAGNGAFSLSSIYNLLNKCKNIYRIKNKN
ncbi:sphingomyelin synthase 1, putative [Plasmodium gallinaceum]|uniref:Sphingomyelin synthase 1, putative n=1 Tax=Plasmodium gallinaceum TaxID=5849 RepID=A0A1J1GN20_PLAGA|nr:sphingomyelin synthase 1, putative [Plasmodium gallinaceum]CRG93826.1 sphingomyelin synthase 1, putative [Plasmodium gallinaceum]